MSRPPRLRPHDSPARPNATSGVQLVGSLRDALPPAPAAELRVRATLLAPSHDRWRAEPRSNGEAVANARRNGHATVLAQVVDLLMAIPEEERRAKVTVMLSNPDEVALREADERQLPATALAIAARGSTDDWRRFLRDHFLRRYDITLAFDAVATRVVP